jgi:uncharacterized protein YbjT (DUF2867 family)
MVGGGARGVRLGRELAAEGHAVRIVTRREERRAEIEAAGCECWIGDPDRIGTLRYALDNATVLLWLLATAAGPGGAPLHGSRLRMMLERTVDTTVRGVVYEGTDPAGLQEMERANRLNEIPYAVLRADPADADAWHHAARQAIDSLLSAARG